MIQPIGEPIPLMIQPIRGPIPLMSLPIRGPIPLMGLPIGEPIPLMGAPSWTLLWAGLFIQLVDGVDGFCHISELSENFIRSMDQVGSWLGLIPISRSGGQA